MNNSPFVCLFGKCPFFLFFSVILLVKCVIAQDDEILLPENKVTVQWFTPVSIQCEGVSLSSVLEQWGEKYDFTVFIDRRIDPARNVDCSLLDVPLIKAIQMLLEQYHLSFAVLDSLLYVGPADGGGKLLLYINQNRELLESQIGSHGNRLLTPFSFSCEKFASPESSLNKLATKLNFRWEKLDKMPFDCWKEHRFISVVPVNLIQMLLIGFDVRLDIDLEQKIFRPVRVDQNESVTRLYDESLASLLNTNDFPSCHFETLSDASKPTMRISGPVAEMADVEYAVALQRMEAVCKIAEKGKTDSKVGEMERTGVDWIDGENQSGDMEARNPDKQRRKGERIKVITGKVQNKELGEVLVYLKANLGTVYVLDPSLQQKRITEQTNISCEFKQADEKTVCQIIADQLNISWRRENKKVIFYVP